MQKNLDQFHALLKENAVLIRELGRVQERATRLLAEKTNEIEQLSAQLVQAHARSVDKYKSNNTAWFSAE